MECCCNRKHHGRVRRATISEVKQQEMMEHLGFQQSCSKDRQAQEEPSSSWKTSDVHEHNCWFWWKREPVLVPLGDVYAPFYWEPRNQSSFGWCSRITDFKREGSIIQTLLNFRSCKGLGKGKAQRSIHPIHMPPAVSACRTEWMSIHMHHEPAVWATKYIDLIMATSRRQVGKVLISNSWNKQTAICLLYRPDITCRWNTGLNVLLCILTEHGDKTAIFGCPAFNVPQRSPKLSDHNVHLWFLRGLTFSW